MDNELFELCKQVYENTAWKTNQYINKYTGRIKIEGIDLFTGDDTPLYTSDYLLEKLPLILPQNNGSSSDFFFHLTPGLADDQKWLAKYQDIDEGQLVAEYGPTAIVALLKLTLALKEAGEL